MKTKSNNNQQRGPTGPRFCLPIIGQSREIHPKPFLAIPNVV